MRSMVVSTDEIARSGGVLSAAYYATRTSPDETYTEWKDRTARLRSVAYAQRRVARLGGIGDHDPSCQCLGSGFIDSKGQLVPCGCRS